MGCGEWWGSPANWDSVCRIKIFPSAEDIRAIKATRRSFFFGMIGLSFIKPLSRATKPKRTSILSQLHAARPQAFEPNLSGFTDFFSYPDGGKKIAPVSVRDYKIPFRFVDYPAVRRMLAEEERHA